MNSNLGKVFCRIINSRLINFLTRHNVFGESIIGFISQILFFLVFESESGGKIYDIIKSIYINNKCRIKFGNIRTFFFQKCGVRQGCCLNPTLFNIYFNELATILEKSAAPVLTLHDSEIKFLLYAEDLVSCLLQNKGYSRIWTC